MKVVKNNKYLYLVLIIFIGLCIFLICNSNSDKETKLEQVELSKEENISKELFAIMLGDEEGNYTESGSNAFPAEGYTYNAELSGCIDTKGNLVSDIMTYDTTNNLVTVSTDTTVYCYLYFEYAPVPKEFTFYVGGNSNPEYITSTSTIVYLSWKDTNITHYCVTNTQGSDNCTWNEISGNSIDTSYALTSGDGTKTVYAYLKNNLGNISPEMIDTIYLDSSAPTSNSVSINSGATYATSTSVTLTLSSTGATQMCISNTTSCSSWEDYTTSKNHTLTTGDGTKTVYVWFRDEYGNTSEYVTDTINLDTAAPTSNSVKIKNGDTYTTSTSVTLTLSSTGATEMCISNTSSCSSWVTYATSKSHTLTTGDGTKTVYVWFRDAAGNTTISYVLDSITLDTAAPTVTASASSNNTASPKISITSSEAGTYCVNTTSTKTNFSNCTLTGSILANTALTTSALSSSGTYYVHVKDTAGNVGGSSAVSITKVTTASSYIQSLNPSGLNTTMEGGLYRFQGTDPNNYICFGTSTKSTCTGNTDAYMYRIIGINSSGQLKIIKKEALNSTIRWYSNDLYDKSWPDSTIYSSINGSSFYTNTTYMPTSWQSKIATVNWKYGDLSTKSPNYSPSNLYEEENSWTTTVSAKIALMYLHDYSYATTTVWGCNSDSSVCKSSWIHLSQNDSSAPNENEWTMARNPIKDGSITYGGYSAQIITSDGTHSSKNTSSNNVFSVRPVFYLTSSVNYVSGTGTSSDPFIIS